MKFDTEVIEIIKRTADVKSVRLRRPKGFDYIPGQWASIILGKENSPEMKPLSFSSSPTEDFLEVTKRLTGHEFSNAFDTLNIGDSVSVSGPYGNLTFHGEFDKICMLSGGIGITPLRSMIRYSTDKDLKTNIILLYSNRFEDGIAFKDDFDAILERNPNFKFIVTITGPTKAWKGFTGRINLEMIKKIAPDYADRVFYTCGPRPMVDAMATLLTKMGLPRGRIRYEYFTGYLGAPEGQSSQV